MNRELHEEEALCSEMRGVLLLAVWCQAGGRRVSRRLDAVPHQSHLETVAMPPAERLPLAVCQLLLRGGRELPCNARELKLVGNVHQRTRAAI